MSKLKILDIGCGMPHQKTKGSIGIDKWKAYQPDIVLDLNNNDIPFPENTFDLVVSDDTIEHFENPSQIFREAYRVLKPGGIFQVETVAVSFIAFRLFPMDFNKFWRHKIGTLRTGHLTHWTPDMLSMYFEMNKFELIQIKGNGILSYNIKGVGTKPITDLYTKEVLKNE